MSLLDCTAVELAAKIKAGEVTAVEAMQAVVDQIEKSEAELNCYVTFDKEKALQAAAKADEDIKAGKLTGPLAGVPFAIKDNMCTEGMLTTCSSKILGNFVPTFSSEAVIRLQEAGAVIIGKTNMDEFAMGSTTETSAFGATKNPRNTEHVPGGSSGGSAAAVAANECFAALGSDTGGSIRQPASYCGVVGMKPTYGTVSRYGLIAYGSSLDQIGPLCKDVTDCATIMEVIAAKDDKDSTSVKREDTAFTKALVDDVKGLKIGIPRDYFGDGLDPEVKEAVMSAAKVLEEKGAIVEVQIVLVMSREAKLYLLDEPMGGVDPAARDYILRTIISNYNEDATVVITTHLISDIENVLDEVVFIKQGEVYLKESVDDIRTKYNKSVDALFREVFVCY